MHVFFTGGFSAADDLKILMDKLQRWFDVNNLSKTKCMFWEIEKRIMKSCLQMELIFEVGLKSDVWVLLDQRFSNCEALS